MSIVAWAYVGWCYCRYVFGVLRGMVYSRLGRYERALSVYRDLERLAPGEPVPKAGVAWMLVELGRRDEAMEVLKESVGVSAFTAASGLGEKLVELGRGEEALPYLRQAAALEPGEAEVWHRLGRQLVICAVGAQIRGLRRLRWRPWEAAALEGRRAEWRARWEEAARVWQRVGELHADDPDHRVSLAMCLQKLGRREEAAALYREALRCDPQDKLARIGLDGLSPQEAAAAVGVCGDDVAR